MVLVKINFLTFSLPFVAPILNFYPPVLPSLLSDLICFLKKFVDAKNTALVTLVMHLSEQDTKICVPCTRKGIDSYLFDKFHSVSKPSDHFVSLLKSEAMLVHAHRLLLGQPPPRKGEPNSEGLLSHLPRRGADPSIEE